MSGALSTMFRYHEKKAAHAARQHLLLVCVPTGRVNDSPLRAMS